MAKIVNTDNFGGDYPNERFVTGLFPMTKAHAEKIAKAINSCTPEDCPRYWIVVDDNYKLKPGFEP